jgi:UDP-N-acetylmuramate--alanine ligase
MYKKAHIHFVGIGGIGMSGIATILKYQGYTISGCDSDLDQHSIKNLTQIGCSIAHGNNSPACADPSIDILVYSSVIQGNNPEIVAAQQRGIATIPRALMLAELMRTKYSVAIAGSHGKTTTTSLISHILIEAQIDPTVIIGGHLQTISNNARFGESDFLVAEADESDRSFLHLQPTLAVVTNIDLEHLETYKDLEDIKHTFQQFLARLPFYGKAFVCADDENLASILPISHVTTVKYGLDSRNDIFAQNIQLNATHSTFDVYQKQKPLSCSHPEVTLSPLAPSSPKASPGYRLSAPSPFAPSASRSERIEGNVSKGQLLGRVHLNMPGKHNILNALGALALSLDLEIPFDTIAAALANFQGVDQRFTYRGTFQGVRLFDDYGHHPKEIEVTLEVARQCTKNKICVIFQPHRYTRTYHLWDNFLEVFLNSKIDHLLITDIWPASEQPIPDVTSSRLAQELQAHNPSFSVSYAPYERSLEEIEAYVRANAHKYDLILFLGAGKVNKLAHTLLK